MFTYNNAIIAKNIWKEFLIQNKYYPLNYRKKQIGLFSFLYVSANVKRGTVPYIYIILIGLFGFIFLKALTDLSAHSGNSHLAHSVSVLNIFHYYFMHRGIVGGHWKDSAWSVTIWSAACNLCLVKMHGLPVLSTWPMKVKHLIILLQEAKKIISLEKKHNGLQKNFSHHSGGRLKIRCSVEEILADEWFKTSATNRHSKIVFLYASLPSEVLSNTWLKCNHIQWKE